MSSSLYLCFNPLRLCSLNFAVTNTMYQVSMFKLTETSFINIGSLLIIRRDRVAALGP